MSFGPGTADPEHDHSLVQHMGDTVMSVTVAARDHHTGPRRALILLPVLGIWLALALALNLANAFETGRGGIPVALAAAAVGPPALFLVVYRTSARLRTLIDTLDLGVVVGLQGWRVLGGMFLVLMGFGLLPPVFAWPAGVGDVMVGVAAPFVAGAYYRRAPGWTARVRSLTYFGIADFVVAIGTGFMSTDTALRVFEGPITSDAMAQLPLALIPSFLVPLFVILHLIALIKLRGARAG